MITEGEIKVPVWTSSGGMRVRRDSLEPEHPESTYNYIKNVLGKDPEDYGYYCHELSEEQKNILRTIPNEVLCREVRLREKSMETECNFG